MKTLPENRRYAAAALRALKLGHVALAIKLWDLAGNKRGFGLDLEGSR